METAVNKTNTRKPPAYLNALVFLSVLLIGADTWGVNIGGFNFRFVQVILLAAGFVVLVKNQYKFYFSPVLIAFIGLYFVSCLFSVSVTASLIYFVWLLYNVFIILFLFASYVSSYGIQNFMKILRLTFYVQTVLLALQFFLELIAGYKIPFFTTGTFMGIPRPALWFYEPSYLATYFSFWLIACGCLFLRTYKRIFLADFLIALAGMALCTATTGFLAIGATFLIVFILAFYYKRNRVVIILLAAVILAYIAILIFLPNVLSVFVGRLFSDGIVSASGGRIDMWAETWKVFLTRPLFGVGPNCYGEFLGFDRSYVPSNVTLELLSTTGIFVTVAFIVFIVGILRNTFRTYKKEKGEDSLILWALGIGLILFLVVLQANQGYMRLYMWMIFGILLGGTSYVKKQNKIIAEGNND